MKALKLFRKESSPSSKNTRLEPSWKVYNTLEEIPILIWFKVNDTNDFNLLINYGNPKDEDLIGAWVNIMDEYVKYIGISDSYKELLETKKKLQIAKINYELTNDLNHLNFINIYESILKKHDETNGENNYYKIIEFVEDFLKRDIDENIYSARKFFEKLMSAKKHVEKMQLKQSNSNG